MEDVRPSIERSPKKAHPVSGRLSSMSHSESQSSLVRSRKRPFNLRADEDENSVSFQSSDLHQTNGALEEEYTGATGDDSMQILQDNDDGVQVQQVQLSQEKQEEDDTISAEVPKSKGGRPRKNLPAVVEKPDVRPTAAKNEGKAGHRPASVDLDLSQPSVSAAIPRKGRPSKKTKLPVLQDNDTENIMEDERPAKRPKNGSVNNTPQIGRPKKTKPSPSKRDPNAKITSIKQLKTNPVPLESQNINDRPKPRGLYIMRSGTPAEDDGSRTTRSGRTSVKPLAYWRNERIVYGEDEAGTKERYLLPTIKEVIRTEEVEQPRPKKAKGRSKAAGRSRRLEDVEEEDEDQEPWEAGEGIMRGLVRVWDSAPGLSEDDEDENGACLDLAESPTSRFPKHN